MSGSGGNVGAQAGDSNPDMNRTTSAENNAKEKDGKVSTTSNNIYSHVWKTTPHLRVIKKYRQLHLFHF